MTLTAPWPMPQLLSAPVRSATVRELIALLASGEEGLRDLRRMAPADAADVVAVAKARDDLLHLQGRIVRELRRRRRLRGAT